MSKRIFVLNGPNLNLLGQREPAIYGTTTLAEIEMRCEAKARGLGYAIDFRQTNFEGELVESVHQARQDACGIIINPAGYSFTSVALLFNLVIVVAVMSKFGATMTLPGFAGLALSVGLSVDANVLINERIREELRLGIPPKAAIAMGYDRASHTIMDANLTGLIVGIALYAFGTGPLKGFALTMIIGIFASMFTAITVSRALATLIYGRRKKLQSVAI